MWVVYCAAVAKLCQQLSTVCRLCVAQDDFLYIPDTATVAAMAEAAVPWLLEHNVRFAWAVFPCEAATVAARDVLAGNIKSAAASVTVGFGSV